MSVQINVFPFTSSLPASHFFYSFPSSCLTNTPSRASQGLKVMEAASRCCPLNMYGSEWINYGHRSMRADFPIRIVGTLFELQVFSNPSHIYAHLPGSLSAYLSIYHLSFPHCYLGKSFCFVALNHWKYVILLLGICPLCKHLRGATQSLTSTLF